MNHKFLLSTQGKHYTYRSLRSERVRPASLNRITFATKLLGHSLRFERQNLPRKVDARLVFLEDRMHYEDTALVWLLKKRSKFLILFECYLPPEVLASLMAADPRDSIDLEISDDLEIDLTKSRRYSFSKNEAGDPFEFDIVSDDGSYYGYEAIGRNIGKIIELGTTTLGRNT